MDLSQFTITGDKEKVADIKSQNERLIRLRWVFISLLPWTAAISSYATSNIEFATTFFFVGVAGLTINLLLYVACKTLPKKQRYYQGLMVTQLSIDILFASFSTFASGGVDSRTTAIYAIPIISSGLIFANWVVYFTAAASGLTYAGSVLLEISVNQRAMSITDVFVPIVFYPILFMLIGRLTGYLIKRARDKTREKAYESFLALLSHQLKHPVSTISVVLDQIDFLQDSSASPEKQKKYIEILKSENQSMQILLNNLLATAQEEGNINTNEHAELPRILQMTAYHCAEKHKRTEDLKLVLKDIQLDIQGGSEKLVAAFANIIDNAFMYSESGTPVSVSLEKVKNNAIVTVSDKGKGMSRTEKKKAFTRFNLSTDKAKSGIRGLGLGLFVARKIITAYGGSLHVVSNKQGTSVIITLKRGIQ